MYCFSHTYQIDNVFDEDQGFYRALVSLLADAKCPVIMTCNGMKLVMCLFKGVMLLLAI